MIPMLGVALGITSFVLAAFSVRMSFKAVQEFNRAENMMRAELMKASAAIESP